MNIERITAHKTSNGMVWEDAKKANQHQTKLDMKAHYESDMIYGDCDGAKADWDEVSEWLRRNKEFVINYLERR